MLVFDYEPPIVLNKRGKRTDGIYVGRPSKYGNRFEIGKDGNRAQVIEKFEAWIRTQPELIAAAKKELAGKNLICWCAPLSCHAEVLIKIANELS